jgi:hypothetical protein
MDRLIRASGFIRETLHQPLKIFWLCLGVVVVSLLLNGNLIRLYGLHRDYDRIQDQILAVRGQIFHLRKQMTVVQDPTYIERQALDRYDLVEENDLVFVFADE